MESRNPRGVLPRRPRHLMEPFRAVATDGVGWGLREVIRREGHTNYYLHVRAPFNTGQERVRSDRGFKASGRRAMTRPMMPYTGLAADPGPGLPHLLCLHVTPLARLSISALSHLGVPELRVWRSGV